MMKIRKKLYRNKQEGIIGGVCAGLARYFNIDVSFLRIACIFLAFFSFFTLLLVYVIAWIIIPNEQGQAHLSNLYQNKGKKQARFTEEKTVELKKRLRSFDKRLRKMETVVTSEEWQLRRKFKDIET